ncbi:ABC transporter permease [Alicyclobacillus acidocaldarius]|uniref:ABC-2 type transporter n=1 Tax=Alicyclobacillus acidocaldarius (strain Tc-4-1) TaxID=1048834 RepID=F8IDB3_ALIAT|nr:ABC transporter permease [Alicyclobacillus acidocaldarius]AEJ42579.1 ABC-2 type transporter [Alicyclobacillus acidocaldarius subsp. acidocaldarius Tc-4-1]
MNSWLLEWRIEVLRNVRNRRFFIFTLLFPVGFYLLYVNLYGRHAQVGGIEWSKYFLISMSVFGVVGTGLNGNAVRVAIERTQGWTSWMLTTPRPAAQAVTTKIAANVVVNAIAIAIMFLVGAFVEHVRMPAGEWLGCGAATVFGALVFTALGILIGHIGGREAAQILASIVYFLISIAGGLWIPIQVLPPFFQHLALWMPIYRLADIAWSLIGQRTVQWSDVAVLLAYLIGFVLLAAWVSTRPREVRSVA